MNISVFVVTVGTFMLFPSMLCCMPGKVSFILKGFVAVRVHTTVGCMTSMYNRVCLQLAVESK